MKKTLYIILLCGLALLLFPSCNKEQKKGNEQSAVSTMRAVFYTAVTDAETTLQLLPGKSKNLDAYVAAKEDAVSDITLKLSLKIDSDGLEAYNQAHPDAQGELLPSSAYSFVSNDMMMARYNKKSTSAKIKITAVDLEFDKLYVLPVTIDKVEGTDNWELAENPQAFITVMQTLVGPEGGDGSMEFPYELSTLQDLVDMRKKLSADEKVFFKLMNDIDMADLPPLKDEQGEVMTTLAGDPIYWTPLNYASPYTFAIDFDGGGHTISNFHCNFAEYPSFFGVLNGYCHDVTFTNAKVVAISDVRTGILSGYCGTGDIRGDVARVHIQGELDHTASTKYGAGGFFGYLANGAMYACSADVVVTSKQNNVGGLAGYVGKTAEITDCWTSGVITGPQRVGGIVGGTDGKDEQVDQGIKIINCYSLATVHGSFPVGGIGGFFNMASTVKGSPLTNNPGNHIEYCIAWNDEIRAMWNQNTQSSTITPGDKSHYSSGAVIGYTAVNNYLIGCVRNAAMKYNEAHFFDYTDAFSLYDQDDASPASPLSPLAVADAEYNFPYHGKASGEGETLTQVAQRLGWSSTIWDFSNDIPTLRPDAQVGPVPDVTTDGQIPGFGENEIN